MYINLSIYEVVRRERRRREEEVFNSLLQTGLQRPLTFTTRQYLVHRQYLVIHRQYLVIHRQYLRFMTFWLPILNPKLI